MPLNLEKAAREGRAFLNFLSRQLDHAADRGQTSILLKAALHALRNRISMQQSLHLMAQLPIFMKVMYVEGWKYHDQPVNLCTREEFVEYVKTLQYRYGEYQFDWPEPTAELLRVVYHSLRRFVSEGEMQKIVAELPQSLKPFFEPGGFTQPLKVSKHSYTKASSLRDNAAFEWQGSANRGHSETRSPVRQAIYLANSLPSGDLFEQEELNEARVGVQGSGANTGE